MSKSVLNSKTFAGLALHNDSLRYIEVAKKDFKIVKHESVQIASGAIVKDQVNAPEALGEAFESLKRSLGKFTCPVVVGIPSRDISWRLIDYPRMSLEDLRGVISLEFDKHFPYSWNNAVTDLTEVDVPRPDTWNNDNMTVLVAAGELNKTNNLLKFISRSSMQLLALEPMNLAFFRTATGAIKLDGAYLVMDVGLDVTNIMLGYNDNCILFRSTPVDLTKVELRDSDEGLQPIVRDVQNTLVFAGNQYKGIEIKNMILGGRVGNNLHLKALLENWASLDIMTLDLCDLWQTFMPGGNASDYEAAFGLALRNII